jgi:hypothetical protein
MLTCIAFYSYQCKAYLSIRVPTENGRVLTTNNFNRLILRDSWFAPGAKSAGFLPTGRKPKFMPPQPVTALQILRRMIRAIIQETFGSVNWSFERDEKFPYFY